MSGAATSTQDSPARRRDDFSQLSKLPKIDRHPLRGTLGHRLFLIRARRGKEEFGQANFDADVLPEPAGRLEIVKHVTGYGKILSERDLKLEMAPQEVISTDRHIGLRDPDRQSGDEKSAVCSHLLASPRLLYANGGKKKRARIIAQEGLEVVRRPLRQRIVCQDSGERGARRIDHLERTVAVGVERCVGDQIEKQPLKAWRKLSKSLGPSELRGVGELPQRASGGVDESIGMSKAPVLERNEGPDRKRPALVISRVCSWVVVGGRDCGCIASDDAAEHRGHSSQHDGAPPGFRQHLPLLAVRTAEAGLVRIPLPHVNCINPLWGIPIEKGVL